MKKKKNMYIYLCIEIFFNKLLFTLLFLKILIFSVPSKLLLLSWNNVLKKNQLSIRLFWRWAGFLRKPDLCLLWLADQVASNSYQGMLVSAYLIDACGQLSGILISGKFNVWKKKVRYAENDDGCTFWTLSNCGVIALIYIKIICFSIVKGYRDFDTLNKKK